VLSPAAAGHACTLRSRGLAGAKRPRLLSVASGKGDELLCPPHRSVWRDPSQGGHLRAHWHGVQ